MHPKPNHQLSTTFPLRRTTSCTNAGGDGPPSTPHEYHDLGLDTPEYTHARLGCRQPGGELPIFRSLFDCYLWIHGTVAFELPQGCAHASGPAHAERAVWLFASEVLSLTLDENKVVGIGEYEGVTGMWTLTCVLYAWGLVQDTIEAMHCKHHVMIKAMTSAETHTNSTSPKGVAITKRMPVSTHMIHEPTIETLPRHFLDTS